MGVQVMFQNMHTSCDDQIREIDISITLNIDHFFVERTLKSLLVILKYATHYC